MTTIIFPSNWTWLQIGTWFHEHTDTFNLRGFWATYLGQSSNPQWVIAFGTN
jgi:hypothetical protein